MQYFEKVEDPLHCAMKIKMRSMRAESDENAKETIVDSRASRASVITIKIMKQALLQVPMEKEDKREQKTAET